MLLIITINLCAAITEYTDLNFNLVNDKGGVIKDSIIHLEIQPINSTNSQKYDKYVTEGILNLRFNNGKYITKFFIREEGKKFYNYYAEQNIDTNAVADNTTIIFLPVAYIMLNVVDSNNNVVTDATLKFDCPSNSFSGKYSIDSFGSFSLNNVYLGQCKIYASGSDGAGSISVDINESKIYDVKIMLEQKPFQVWPYILVSIMVILLIGYVIYVKVNSKDNNTNIRKKNKNFTKSKSGITAKNIETNKSSDKLESKNIGNEKLEAVMKTLDKYEREVIQYLIDNNGEATQNKIRNHTAIPKTSLFRCVQRLEKKQLVHTESIGKMKKVILNEL